MVDDIRILSVFRNSQKEYKATKLKGLIIYSRFRASVKCFRI